MQRAAVYANYQGGAARCINEARYSALMYQRAGNGGDRAGGGSQKQRQAPSLPPHGGERFIILERPLLGGPAGKWAGERERCFRQFALRGAGRQRKDADEI